MNWLKQNWIKLSVGLGVFLIVIFYGLSTNQYANIIDSSPTYTPEMPFPYFGEKEVLSLDKKFTVFLKVDPKNDVAEKYGVYGHIPYDEIWIRDNSSGKEKMLVKTGDVSNYPFAKTDAFPFSDIYGLQDITFSLDSKKVYFSSYAWETAMAIFSVDISTSKLKFVSDGNSLEVIDTGPYAGNLNVLKHKYYGLPDYGSYDHYYIITDSGKKIKDLGGVSHINGEEIQDK